MADVHGKAIRSYNMSRIQGFNTKPEIIVRKFLHANGFRYRLHNKKLPSCPDITLRRYNTVIFVNGCFWHGHDNCKYFVIPKTRTGWWKNKIEETKKRDYLSLMDLESLGWNTLVVWECELKHEKRSQTLVNLVNSILKKETGYVR
jgi:DNA mismatch endonuclease, patch repair protein